MKFQVDEKAIIEAIKHFGTPVWEAARIYVWLEAVGLLALSGLVLFLFIGGLLKWKRVWEQRVLDDSVCDSCKKPDETDGIIIFYVLSIFFGLAFAIFIGAAVPRIFAVDFYAFRELLR